MAIKDSKVKTVVCIAIDEKGNGVRNVGTELRRENNTCIGGTSKQNATTGRSSTYANDFERHYSKIQMSNIVHENHQRCPKTNHMSDDFIVGNKNAGPFYYKHIL
jgi:putative heme iron utilization protein